MDETTPQAELVVQPGLLEELIAAAVTHRAFVTLTLVIDGREEAARADEA